MPVENLIRRIRRRRYTNLKPWVNRNTSGGSFSILKRDIRALLVILAGGENMVTRMLQSVLKKDQITSIDEKYKSALKNMNDIFDKQKKFERYQYLQTLKNANLTRNQAKEIGFNFSNNLWNGCLDSKLKNGRKPIDENLIEAIQTHMELFSKESSNRTCKRVYEGYLLL